MEGAEDDMSIAAISVAIFFPAVLPPAECLTSSSSPAVSRSRTTELIQEDLRKLKLVQSSSTVPSTRREYVTARTAGLGALNTITSPEDFSAVIQTKVPGVEAGVIISPLAAIPGIPPLARGINVLLASLNDGGARWGVGYNLLLNGREPITISQVGLNYCTEPEADALDKAAAIAHAFENVCDGFIGRLPAQPNDEALSYARAACGLKQLGPLTLVESVSYLIQVFDRPTDKLPNECRPKIASLKSQYSTFVDSLRGFELERGLSCFASAKGRKLISEAVVRTEWSTPRFRLGARYTEDRQVHRWGFNPEEGSAELPSGEVLERRALVEIAFQLRRFQAVISGGYHGSLVDVSDGDDVDTKLDKQRVQGSAIGLAVDTVICAIDGGSLYDGKEIRVEGDVVPPRLSIGLDLQMTILGDRPASQDSVIDAAMVTPHLDVLVNDKLQFRLGIPISAETKLRPRDEMKSVVEKRGLQWSMSPLVFTVLKL